MNDHAYDISYLEAELIDAGLAPVRTIAKAPPTTPSRQATVAAAQEAMARELLQAAEVHEAMIQQYLGISGALVTDDPYR